MHRILFTIPIGNGMPIFGYGLFLMLGFLAGIGIAWHRAKKRGISTNATIDIGLISIIAGVLGARLAYLLIDYQPHDGGIGNPAEWFAVWEGGLTFQGGLFLALLADYFYLRWKKISVGEMFDIYAPSLALGVGFGRIGCLFNGCCWGKPAPDGTWWSMLFPIENEPMQAQLWLYNDAPDQWAQFIEQLGYPAGTLPPIPIYATQIVSAIGLFLIALGLVWAERRWKNRKPGQVIIWFLFAYGVGRFIIEYFRDDTPLRYGFGAFPGLRLGQWLAVVMIAAGIAFQIMLSKSKSRGTSATE